MDKIRVLIADDEWQAIDLLKSLLQETGKVEVVQVLQDPVKIESLVNKLKPDVLFLDIEMPGINGLQVVENIREYNQDLIVIFVSAYNKYIENAIKLNVYTYLLKPVDRKELKELTDKLSLLKRVDLPSAHNKLKLPIKSGYVYIKPEELLTFNAEGNYTRIMTIKGEEYLSSYNMGRLFQKLPSCFYRINRSCVLNGEFIYRIDKTNQTCEVRIDDKEMEFEVSSSFITEFNRRHK
ncbi:LytTR family DNA-binding domain-containing protein [Draconibacterium sp. IB214405]|uniref:LytR/AlgR family response regulator transcription factor n=1 Tax=Draconibacterium sp. IB214405 TaxID=3097352 RepID=UPI002A15499B|nr:LytTR family DNA-binding domain-containing protein [Draconibacterium sp. IB214405]MDX8339283.1 LytTR family DNA-binding domain-containing protein [Draconibacterium sp. IB214405]